MRAEFSVGKLTSVLAKKTQSDLDRVFKGTSKTRDRLSYMDEVLALWRLDDLEDTLDELEETLLSVDFGPATSTKVLDEIRERVAANSATASAPARGNARERTPTLASSCRVASRQNIFSRGKSRESDTAARGVGRA